MLNSFYIKNYRLFEELEIKTLKRVNLIVGKNNVGKSALLEALLIHHSQGDIRTINAILKRRGEWLSDESKAGIGGETEYQGNLSYLFHQRKTKSDEKERFITLGESPKENILLAIDQATNYTDQKTGDKLLKIVSDKEKKAYLDKELFWILDTKQGEEYAASKLTPSTDSKFIHQLIFSDNEPSDFSELWGKVYLTPKEDQIVQALQIIEPKLKNIGLHPVHQKFQARLENLENPILLSSMGGGINRMLTIILSMVNCENGIFLIDEIETGLHWSVQADLWQMVFKLSEELNIQVFATTHSWDTVRTLAKVVEREAKLEETQFIKLTNKAGNTKALSYDQEDFKIAIEDNVEIR